MLVEDLIAFLQTNDPKARVLFVDEGDQFLRAKHVVPYVDIPAEIIAQTKALGLELPLPAQRVKADDKGVMYLAEPLGSEKFLPFVLAAGTHMLTLSADTEVVLLRYSFQCRG